MNHEYDKQLETEIDRELKALRELQAPPGLATRVMKVLENRARLPWYRQAWPMWSPALRFATLALLLTLFGGLCFAGWKITQLEAVMGAFKQVNHWVAAIGAMGNALHVLVATLALLLKQLGTGFIVASLAIIAAGYALCLGLGTVSLRLAYARR